MGSPRQRDEEAIAEQDRWNRNIQYHSVVTALAPARRALDVGCGGGMLARQLAPLCAEVVGIDIHEPSISEARTSTHATNVEFILGDVLTFAFSKESFELVVSVATIHHIDAAAGLQRFGELLEPGGRLGIIGINRSVFPRDLGRDALAAAATNVHRRARREQRWEHSAPTVWPPPLDDREMKRLASDVLPGSKFRRRLHGRYSLTWTKPS